MSPGREVAERIAALYGEKPKMITVKMVGSKDVARFIRMIQRASKQSHKSTLKLD